MTMMVATSRPDTCPAWCVTKHGELQDEEDHLHISAGLRLTAGVAAHLCITIDPYTGATDGPYILADSEEWTLDQARSIGHALIALTEDAEQINDGGRGH